MSIDDVLNARAIYSGTITITLEGHLEDAHHRCQFMNRRGLAGSVEVIYI